MTEEIPSDRHTKHSSQEIAVFHERMKNYERDRKEANARDQLILDTLGSIRSTLATINTQLAVGELKMEQIDKHLEHTDTTVSNLQAVIESDRRGPVALILGTLSGIGTAATAIWVGIKG